MTMILIIDNAFDRDCMLKHRFASLSGMAHGGLLVHIIPST